MRNIKTRDPKPTNRDPAPKNREQEELLPQERKPRRYIPAGMPTVCPVDGHSTRMANGRHVDPVRKTILEYRTCTHCGLKLAAGRPMTLIEERQFCDNVDAVRDYENMHGRN